MPLVQAKHTMPLYTTIALHWRLLLTMMASSNSVATFPSSTRAQWPELRHPNATTKSSTEQVSTPGQTTCLGIWNNTLSLLSPATWAEHTGPRQSDAKLAQSATDNSAIKDTVYTAWVWRGV